jgi:hypothetical protein
MFVENIYKDVKVPMFFAQPLYDEWSIGNVMRVNSELSEIGD